MYLKNYKQLIKIKPKHIFLTSLTIILINTLNICLPITLSLLISHTTQGNFQMAFLWLSIMFLLQLLQNLAWHINYLNYSNIVLPTYKNLYLTLANSTINNFNYIDKEAINFVITNDIFNISSFLDKFITKLGKLLKYFTVLTIITFYNYIIGLFLLFASIVIYFLVAIYNKHKLKLNQEIYTASKRTNEKFDEILNKQNLIADFSLEDITIKEQERRLDEYIYNYKKLNNYKSIKDNWLKILWAFLISICFIFLINSFSVFKISLPIFLLLIDYITTFSNCTNEIFDIKILFSELNNSITRYNKTLYPNTQNQFLIQNHNAEITINGKIKINSKIHNKNFKVNKGSINYIKENNQTTPLKQCFFKQIENNFSIFIDNYNICNLTKKEYLYLFGFANTKTNYFSDSLIKNMLIINPNANTYKKEFKLFNIKDIIEKLENKENTNLTINKNNLSEFEKFKLSLFRCTISNAKFLLLDINFKLPTKNNLNTILKEIKKNKTIFIFDSSNNNIIFDNFLE